MKRSAETFEIGALYFERCKIVLRELEAAENIVGPLNGGWKVLTLPTSPPNKIRSEGLLKRLELPRLPNPATEQKGQAGGCGSAFCLQIPFRKDPNSKGRGH